MWLLSSSRAELHYFPSPESVPGGYAILSHVWDPPNEQTFQSLQALQASCAKSRRGLNPRDRASAKIRECCKLAEQQGYDWVWVDTCCIDKTSSAELSEAINSMFRYYSLANVCYAFLADVATDDTVALRSEDSAFRKSRWHKRGWTLQELLAPPKLLFVTGSWKILGSKAGLSDVLEQVTRIPADVLLNQEEFTNTSVAQRMSWAAGRETTRLEDEAYCLMGIFRINMPTLYGEGRKAFRRLQQEIMRNYADTSLFAWGNAPPEAFSDLMRLSRFPSLAFGHFNSRGVHNVDTRFLATSPSDFASASGTRCALIDPRGLHYQAASLLSGMRKLFRTRAPDKSIPDLPTFEITPYGVRTRIPLLKLGRLRVAILFSYQDNHHHPHQQHLALILSECSAERNPLLDSLPLYCIGHRMRHHRTPDTVVMFQPRMMLLEGNLQALKFYGQQARWTNIYIRDDPIPDMSVSPAKIAACLRPPGELEEVDRNPHLLTSMLPRVHPDFHFSWDSMRCLLGQGYSFTLFHPRNGMVVLEMKERTHHAIWIVLGNCIPHHVMGMPESAELCIQHHWSRVVPRPDGTDPLQLITHNCYHDHIGFQPGHVTVTERTFKYYDSHQFYSVTLRFSSASSLDGLEIHVSEIKFVQPMHEDLLAAIPEPPGPASLGLMRVLQMINTRGMPSNVVASTNSDT